MASRERARSRVLTVARGPAFAACSNAAQRLGWAASADGAQGGLDVTVGSELGLLRAPLKLCVRLEDRQGPPPSTVVRAYVRKRLWLPLVKRQADEALERFLAVLAGAEPNQLTAGAGSIGRSIVRVVALVLLALAALAASLVALPTKTVAGKPSASLPSVALGQPSLYRIEVGLAVFYGGLIVLTPVFYAVIRGRLPVEVSARGAKFAEDVAETVEKSIEDTQAITDRLQEDVRNVNAEAIRARVNIDELAAHAGVKLKA